MACASLCCLRLLESTRHFHTADICAGGSILLWCYKRTTRHCMSGLKRGAQPSPVMCLAAVKTAEHRKLRSVCAEATQRRS